MISPTFEGELDGGWNSRPNAAGRPNAIFIIAAYFEWWVGFLAPVKAIAAVALFSVALPLCAIDDPVRVETGSLSGTPGSSPEVRVYKGVPFAAAPIGDFALERTQGASLVAGHPGRDAVFGGLLSDDVSDGVDLLSRSRTNERRLLVPERLDRCEIQ